MVFRLKGFVELSKSHSIVFLLPYVLTCVTTHAFNASPLTHSMRHPPPLRPTYVYSLLYVCGIIVGSVYNYIPTRLSGIHGAFLVCLSLFLLRSLPLSPSVCQSLLFVVVNTHCSSSLIHLL